MKVLLGMKKKYDCVNYEYVCIFMIKFEVLQWLGYGIGIKKRNIILFYERRY